MAPRWHSGSNLFSDVQRVPECRVSSVVEHLFCKPRKVLPASPSFSLRAPFCWNIRGRSLRLVIPFPSFSLLVFSCSWANSWPTSEHRNEAAKHGSSLDHGGGV